MSLAPPRPQPATVSSARWLRDIFVSLKLTIVLLVFSMVLIFAATLDQVNLGIWAVQEKFFRAFVVYLPIGNVTVPAFPGGYTIGGLLLLNLLAAHFQRFTFAWKKTGILLTHVGLIVLLVGELLTGLWQQDHHMRLDIGETKNYAESFQHYELALIDETDATFDDVVAIPARLLARKSTLQHPKLPFRVVPKSYYPNSSLHSRTPTPALAGGEAPSANLGVGSHVTASPQAITYRPGERNVPSATVELFGVEGSLGTYLVSAHLSAPQTFTHAGRTWTIALRVQRAYQPFSLTLLKFSHDRYAGTEIPKNFSSSLRLNTPDGRDDREVLIYMNNPLRYAGLTFYQAGFQNDDRTSILQVVRNPSWLVPYIACALMTLGLSVQFGIHLVGFAGKRRAGSAGSSTAQEKTAGPRTALPNAAGKYFPAFVTFLALVAIGLTLRAPKNGDDFDVNAFGRMPVLVNGRVKPLDTVARSSLLTMQGRQQVTTTEGRTLTPNEWLLDMLYRSHQADHYPVFEITHPDVLALLNLSAADGAGKKRFSLRQFAGKLGELDRQAKLADETESPLRTPFQRAVVQARNSVALYQRLQNSLVAADSADFLAQLAKFEQALPHRGSADAKLMMEMGRVFTTMEAFSSFRPIPPLAGNDPAAWKTVGAAWNGSFAEGKVDPSAVALAALGRAWRDRQPDAFNHALAGHRQRIAPTLPAELVKSDAETRFNSAQPFYTSTLLYVVAFLGAVVSWLKWPEPLRRAAFGLVVVAFCLTTIGIATRMWLEARPPVTNLYSSALFVGWGAVALCIVLEYFFRNAIGSAAAGLVGFATLLIAHHLALGGDTLEMMRAVLDSNFWLATHVVAITIGYAATFLAGFLALIYVLRGVLTRSLDEATARAIARMIYGIVCFATIFSFVGTILGGIWADQSWGRFWGWDPKENGALLIVIWNAIILHVRWAGMVKTRGLACLAIFGNIVTAWSWFGVNMLGVGLHSYGFMDAAFWWLVAFGVSQLAVIVIAALPTANWRSGSIAR